MRLELVGANPQAEVVGLDPLPGKSNYFIGNDPKRWRTNVPTFAKVRYKNIYRGVDWVYYGNQGQLEYHFVVAPGADPGAITLDLGAGIPPARGRPQRSPVRIEANGDLVISTDGGDVRLHKPVSYQQKDSRYGSRLSKFKIDESELSEGHYVLTSDNHVRFEVPAHDRRKPLIIDPVLVCSTYLRGSGDDSASGIAVDSAGGAYVTGSTQAALFPLVNSFPLPSGTTTGNIAFVTELSGADNSLVYSTFLTGHNGAAGSAIAVDTSGNAYFAGATQSTDFPTTNSYQSASGGASDAFVTKLSPANASAVSLAPAAVDFSGQVVNSTSPTQTVVLQNIGSATLNISNASITGADSGDFAIVGGTCAGSVFSLNTCNLPITFKPTAAGARSATLTITDDAADSPQALPLAGAGEDFGVAVASGSPSAATVTAGGTATFTISVSPLGGFNQTLTLNCTPSPPSVALDGTNSENVTVTATTTAPTLSGPRGPLELPPVDGPLTNLWVALAALSLIGFVWQAGRRRHVALRLVLPMVFGAILAWASCGGGGSSVTHSPGTPAGTYTITLAATSGSLSHSTTVTLKVQ